MARGQVSFRHKLIWIVLGAFIGGAAIAAVVLSVYHLPADGTTPESTVRAFLDGWIAHDAIRMIGQIDPTNRPSAQEIESMFRSTVIGFSDLKFQTSSQTSNKATVRVTGFVNYASP